MKRLKLYTFTLIGVFILSMFLPYEIHDVYVGATWRSRGFLEQENVPVFGVNCIEVYAVLIFLVVIAIVSLTKRNFATALISSIMGIFSLLGIPFLILLLIFRLFGPDKRIGFGMWVAFGVICCYSILLIINAIAEARKRKVKPKVISNDLIDTDF